MDYTLTTVHDAEIELTRLLYMEPTVVESIKALGQEAHDLWARLSHPYRRLSDFAVYENRSYSERRVLDRDRDDLGIHPEISKDNWTQQRVAEFTAGFAALDRSRLRWKDEENWELREKSLEEAREDRKTFEALLDLAAEIKSTVEHRQSVFSEKKQAMDWAEANDVPTQQIHGWYGQVKNNRRTATGWFVKGRGQTIYVLPDPVGMPAATYTEDQAEVIMERIYRNLNDLGHHGDRWISVSFHDQPEHLLEKFSRAHAHVTLILPPALADARREEIVRLVGVVQDCMAEGRENFDAYKAWAETAGKAHRRHEKITEITEGVRETNPRWPVVSSWSGEGERILAALRDIITDEQVALAREQVITALVASNGGPLTDEEKALLEVKPEHGKPSLMESVIEVALSRTKPDLSIV